MDKSHLKCEGISNPQQIYDQLDTESTNPAPYLEEVFRSVPDTCLPQIRTLPLAENSLRLVDYAGSEQYAMPLEPPAIGLIEHTDALEPFCQRVGLISRYNLIGFSITSASASDHNFSRLLCASVQAHFHIPDKSLAPMGLAVQEAAINGLAHGNLGLRSAYQETSDNLNRYYELIRAQAHSEALKNRRLDLFSWMTGGSVFVSVKDDGKGYQQTETNRFPDSHPPLVERRKSGRGLDIMRQFSQDAWLSANGTSVVMRFAK